MLGRELDGSDISTAKRQAAGATIQLAYTLTGEARRYQDDSARFGAVRPADARLGAWELFYRHDHLRVDGEPGLIRPLRSQSHALVNALGVNWCISRAAKLSVNYSIGRTNGVFNDAGDQSGKAVRVQGQYQF